MNSPQIQFVQTSDGMSIAYYVMGRGEPLVFMPVFMGHARNNYLFPTTAALLRALAERFQLIYYDPRGQGLSTRGLNESVTLEDFMLDFEAVRARLELDRFILLGSCNFALQAIHYAVRYPERVSSLVLMNGAVSWDAWKLSSVYDSMPSEDWDLFLYNLVPQTRSAEEARKTVEWFRESMTQHDYLVSIPAWRNASVEHLLPEVKTPTLVLHSNGFRLRAIEGPLELARGLPNSHFVLLDSAFLFGDPGQAIGPIEDFLANRSVGEISLPTRSSPEVLTGREIEVLKLIASGETNREIADTLTVSIRTVERHITHIYGKIKARGKADATAYALRHLPN